MNVLLVDDTEDARMIVRAYLRAVHIEVTMAASGDEAIELYKVAPLPVILMDLRMPGTDGFAATRAIRAYESEHGMPASTIIALSGDSDHGTRDASLVAGCNACMSKPVRRVIIQRKLAELKHDLEPASGDSSSPVEVVPQNLKPLLDSFLARRVEDVGRLQLLWDERNYEGILRFGHALKGNAGSYGFHQLSKLGHELEKHGIERTRATLVLRRGVSTPRARGSRRSDVRLTV